METCKKCQTQLVKQDVQSFCDNLSDLLVTYKCPNCHTKELKIEHLDE